MLECGRREGERQTKVFADGVGKTRVGATSSPSLSSRAIAAPSRRSVSPVLFVTVAAAE